MQRSTSRYRRIALAIVVSCVFCACDHLQADDLISNYFLGLRQRSLYVIAEEYAVNQLARPNLLPRHRAETTIEHARTLVEHGSVSGGQEREALWSEAERLLTAYLNDSPETLFSELVASERAVLPFLFGETLAWEAQFSNGNLSLRKDAEEKLSQGRSLIADALAAFDPLRDPSIQELADGALDRNELRQIQYRLGFLRVKALYALAELQDDARSRSSLLHEAEVEIRSLLRTRLDARISVEAKLLRAAIARQSEQFEQAEGILRSIEDDAGRYGLVDQVLAEQMRLAIDQNRSDAALEIVNQRIQSGPLIADELRAVAVEALLAAWKLAEEHDQSDLQKSLLAQAEYHDSQAHGKWQQLTHFKLRNLLQDNDLGTDLAELVRDAQQTYEAGRPREAAEQFRDAAAIAAQSGRTKHAVEFAFTVGSIQLQIEDWDAAAKTFGAIAKTYRNEDRAVDASLMECYALGRSYAAQPSQSAREQYEQALRNHQMEFTGTESATEASWMLAIHLEQRLQWTDAMAEYQRIPSDDPRFDTASLRIVLLYERILDRLRELHGDVSSWETQLLQEIARINESFPQTRRFESLDQARTALKIAQLLLQHSQRWYDVADIWLSRIEDTVHAIETQAGQQEAPIDSEWLQIARGAAQLRIVSLAGQQRLVEAQELMVRLGETSPDAMLGILLGLTELTSRVEPQRQYDLGRLQLEAIKRLSQSRDQLSPDKQNLLDNAHAEAIVAIGNLREAAAMYESLLTKSAKDQELIEKLIRVLTQSGRNEDLERARHWWAVYERLQKPGTPKWVSARLSSARLSQQLGEEDAARKLLGVTKTLYPQLGSEELKAEVIALLNELNGR